MSYKNNIYSYLNFIFFSLDVYIYVNSIHNPYKKINIKYILIIFSLLIYKRIRNNLHNTCEERYV